METIFVLLRPGSGVRFGLGTLLKVFQDECSLKLLGLKMTNVDEAFPEKYFSDLADSRRKSHAKRISSDPAVVMVFDGEQANDCVLSLFGKDGQNSLPVYHDFLVCMSIPRSHLNVSNSQKAKRDIALWFDNKKDRWSKLPLEDSCKVKQGVDIFIAKPTGEQILILAESDAVDHIGEIIYALEAKIFFLKGLNLFKEDEYLAGRCSDPIFSGLAGPVFARFGRAQTLLLKFEGLP